MNMWKKALAALLCIVMCVSLLPAAAMAENSAAEETDTAGTMAAEETAEEEVAEDEAPAEETPPPAKAVLPPEAEAPSEPESTADIAEAEESAENPAAEDEAAEENAAIEEEAKLTENPEEALSLAEPEADVVPSATADTQATSGSCGDHVTWTLSGTSLKISGSGATWNYSGDTPWYGSRDSIKTVTVAKGVTGIGDLLFCDLSNVTSVTLPDGLTSIGEYAIGSCTALSSLTIPSSVTSIGDAAFVNCPALKSITIPSGVTAIRDNTFDGCSALTTITIPSSVTTIGDAAFCECEALSSLTIPSSVTSIGNYAFENCTALKSITIPSGVTAIHTDTFKGCSALTAITIPGSVTSIGYDAFNGCSSLKTIVFQGNAPTFAGSVFAGVTATAYYPVGNTTWTGDVRKNYGGTITWKTDFLGACTEYASYAVLTATGSGAMNSLPCSLSSDDSCERVYTFDSGVAFTATKLLKNHFGNYWYQASTTVNGTKYEGYVYAGDVTTAITPGDILNVSKITLYNNSSGTVVKGNAQTFLATVTAKHGPLIATVTGKLTGSDGSVQSKKVSGINAASYKITKGGTIDSALKFGSLPLGDATVKVTATAAVYYSDDGKTLQTKTVSVSNSLVVPVVSSGTTTYAVRYDANGGTNAPSAQTKTKDKTLTLSSSTPTRKDTFSGSYTVTLNPNGGSVNPTSLRAAYTGTYRFDYWNTAADGSGTSYDPGDSYTENASVTLYAQWYQDVTVTAVSLPTPTRDGYAFIGWAQNTGASSGVTGSYVAPGDVTLYALWRPLSGSGMCGDQVQWTLTDYGELTISGSGPMWDFGSSSSHENPFSGNTKIRTVKIQNGVTSVGQQAFQRCSQLTDVTIPSSVKSIGGTAFNQCTALMYISLPEGVTSIGTAAFLGCSQAWSIDIPSSVTSIGVWAFGQCGTATGYEIPVEFAGSAPAFGGSAFIQTTAVMYYHPDASWTEDVRQQYGGTLRWSPYYILTLDMNGGKNSTEYRKIKEGSASLGSIYTNAPIRGDEVIGRYTVTLDANGGSVRPGSLTAERTASYSFQNWNTAKNGSGTSYTLRETYYGNADATLYAQWKNYRVTTEALELPLASREGQLFLGWAKSRTAAAVECPAGETFVPDANTTLYALWEEIPASAELTIGAAKKLKTGSINANLVWESSDDTVATVDASGTVTALKYGRATITVMTENGLSSAACEIQTRFTDVASGGKYYSAPVYWAADNGITMGYSDGSFGVGRDCQRRELLIFLWRFAGSPTGYGDARTMFNDMGAYNTSSAANKAVAWAYKTGIVKGYADGGIHPTDSIVRKDVMIMLYRLAGKPAVSGTLTFTDCTKLNKNSDTYRAILWGSQNGITNGYSSGQYKGQFGNNLNCLREQIVTFLYRYNNIQ